MVGIFSTENLWVMLDPIENDIAEFWVENGILYFIYKPNTILKLKTAEKVVKDRLQFQNDKEYPVLCDTRGIIDAEKAARDFLAKEGSLQAKAVAFLVNPPLTEAMAQFYIRTSKPVIPTRIFTKKKEAITFLENFI